MESGAGELCLSVYIREHVGFSAENRHRKTSFLTTTRHDMSGRPEKFGAYGYSRNQLLEQAIAMRSNPLTSIHWGVGQLVDRSPS